MNTPETTAIDRETNAGDNAATQPARALVEVRDSLKQTLFALESVLMLSGSALPPASIPELVKYANAARATLERNP